MNLPNGSCAIVDREKLLDYVLSASHPVGRFKARVFASLGIGVQQVELLRARLLELATHGEAEPGDRSEFGQKYLVRGRIVGSQGSGRFVTVWIVLEEDDRPRFVTVYPE